MNQLIIRINGTGVESFGGTVDFETYQYFDDNNVDLEEYVEEIMFGSNDLDIPDEHNFGINGIEDIDNLWHINGAYLDMNNNEIEVLNSDEEIIWRSSLESEELTEQGVKIISDGDFDQIVNDLPESTAVMLGRKVSSGIILETEIEISGDFDSKNLVIYCHEDDGIDVIKRIEYEGKLVEDQSSSSDGESQEFSWFMNQ